MKSSKKMAVYIAGIILAVLVVMALAVQVLMSRHLTALLRGQVFPRVEESLGVGVAIDHAGMNLARGSASIKQLEVKNPAGFSESSIFALKRAWVDIGLKQLFGSGLFEISDLDVSGAELTIERNREGKVNVDVLADRLNLPAESTRTSEKENPFDMVIKRGSADTVVRYVDEKFGKKLTLNTTFTISNVSTVYDSKPESGGRIHIVGSTKSDSRLCSTDLNVRLSPLVDPGKPSFQMEGSIAGVDMAFAGPYLSAVGMKCDSLSLDVSLVCIDGTYDKSYISFVAKKVALSGDIAKKLPKGIESLSSLTIPMAIKGTFNDPSADFVKSLAKALTENLKNNAQDLIRVSTDRLLEDLKDVDKGIINDEEKEGINKAVKGALNKVFGDK